MRDRILTYIAWMNNILKERPENLDYKELMNRHKDEIEFFQHERFIHLIVMFLFAIATVIVFLVAVTNFQLSLIVLFVALLVLLVPYIRHYFLLENGVQTMYYQYDELRRIVFPEEPYPVFKNVPKEMLLK